MSIQPSVATQGFIVLLYFGGQSWYRFVVVWLAYRGTATANPPSRAGPGWPLVGGVVPGRPIESKKRPGC
jgi:hypothetical protein